MPIAIESHTKQVMPKRNELSYLCISWHWEREAQHIKLITVYTSVELFYYLWTLKSDVEAAVENLEWKGSEWE